MAALCAAVGLGFSTGSLPIFEGLLDEEDEFEFEELAFLNFSLKLQATTTNTIATIRETFFILSPNAGQIRKANAFTGTARQCQMNSRAGEPFSLLRKSRWSGGRSTRLALRFLVENPHKRK